MKRTNRAHIGKHVALASLVFGLVALGACVGDEKDLVTDADQAAFAKKDCPNPDHKKCPDPPPEPPPEPGDVTLPPAILDALPSPVRMVPTPGGRYLVADARLRMIVRVDGTSMLPDQALEIDGKPLSVAILGNEILVGNVSKSAVERYDANGGDYRGVFASIPIDHPSDIEVDSTANLVFVLDGAQHVVRVFDGSGALVRSISSYGIGAAELLNPTAIGLDVTRQEVLVSDYGSVQDGNGGIKIFGYQGGHVVTLSPGNCGWFGGCDGEGTSRPQGLAVAGDLIYVADAFLAEVLIIDRPTDTKLSALGSRINLRVPTDVHLTETGDVVAVANRGGGLVVFPGGAQ